MMQNNKKIVIIGFDNNGYEVFSKLKNKKQNVKTFLYYDNFYKKNKITDYVYYWGYHANGMLDGSISKDVLNYCNSTNPFIEENINADCYIIFYSYFDNNFIDLIDDIVRKIKNNNKKLYGIFSNPFAFEGKRKNEFSRNKLNEIKDLFDNILIYENDDLGKIIELKKPQLIQQLIKNINFLFYLILNKVIENIENNSIENFNNINVKELYNLKNKKN